MKTLEIYTSKNVMRKHNARAQKVFTLHEKNMTAQQIANELNWSRNEVYGVINRAKKSGLWFEMKRGAA